MSRRAIAEGTKRALLIEAGYRCSNPGCRQILTIELHHIDHLAAGGGDNQGNLIALCANCHELHHKGIIPREVIRVWKTTLEALNYAFDRRAIELLLMLDGTIPENMHFSADTFLDFAPLIGSGLVSYSGSYGPPSMSSLRYSLTDKGRRFVTAWKKGDQNALSQELSGMNTQVT